MNESNQITSWIERAEEDYIMARSALRRKTPLVRSACFHAQQCAEKYFKAVLVQRNISFPKTHDLLMLFSLCEEEGIIVPIDPKLLNTLNDY
jgi:HEPN domain-containing protein